MGGASETPPRYLADEIGKMECLSQAFVAGMRSVLDSGKPVVASVAKKGEGLISEVKRRKDSVVWEVTHKNRDALTDQVVGWIKSRLAPLPD
jgi:nucleoside-triphosphatase